MIEMNCPHCGNQLRIDDKFHGQAGQCAKCQGVIHVPALSGDDSHAFTDTSAGPKSPPYKTPVAISESPRGFLPRMNTPAIVLALCLCIFSYFVGVEATKAKMRSIMGEGFRRAAQASPAQRGKTLFATEDIQKRGETVVEFKQNQLVSLATIDVTVHSVEEANTLVPNYGNPIVAPPGGKFLIVEMTVRNRLKAPFKVDPDTGIVVDNKGREFPQRLELMSIENGLLFRELTPGVEESGFLVFRVSEDSSGYALMFRKGGTNEIVRILMSPGLQ